MEILADAITPVSEAERITFRFEKWRAVAGGIIESAGSTFLLYIAVTHYSADANSKALVAAGGNFGMIFSPLIVFWVASHGWRASRVGALFCAAGGAFFAAAALVPSLPVFVAGSVLALICAAIFIPLMTQMYQDNYPEERRGRLFSRAVMIRIAVTTAFSYFAGWLLKIDIHYQSLLLWIFCAALLGSAFCLSRCPSRPLNREGHTNPFKGLMHVRDDALFRQTLISWMLMGFANLMMVQLRVEYLANQKYGKPFDANEIALLTGVIPNIARLLLSPVWGRLFDRMNFFGLRIILNIGFAIGAVAFFAGRDMPSLTLGAIVFGISNAGGDVAWSLWVTKLAPPDRVAEYMSVHTFLTGLRGVTAPFAAFYLVTTWSFSAISAVAAALIIGASLLLIPEIRTARANKPVSAPMVENIPE